MSRSLSLINPIKQKNPKSIMAVSMAGPQVHNVQPTRPSSNNAYNVPILASPTCSAKLWTRNDYLTTSSPRASSAHCLAVACHKVCSTHLEDRAHHTKPEHNLRFSIGADPSDWWPFENRGPTHLARRRVCCSSGGGRKPKV